MIPLVYIAGPFTAPTPWGNWPPLVLESTELLLRYAEQNEAWKAEPGTLDADVWGYLQRVGAVSEERAPQEESHV